MFTNSKKYQIHRTSDKSEIISILENNLLTFEFTNGILIGSRAAYHYLPNFRGRLIDYSSSDWDIIISSASLLKWLNENDTKIKTIDLIDPTSKKKDNKIDLYIYCTLDDETRFDFEVPRSKKSYSAYILQHPHHWINRECSNFMRKNMNLAFDVASPSLLLILKRYMLYYPYQWMKTAKDYRELVTIDSVYIPNDEPLCDLFIRYNERTHEQRVSESKTFIVKSTNNESTLVIRRKEFQKLEDSKKISLLYDVAMKLCIAAGDILVGLEPLCTQAPAWLTDYVIKNWLKIHDEKFKRKCRFIQPSIQFKIESYRLFQTIPEIPTRKIFYFITDTIDFYSMQFVSKQWYALLHDDMFWKDLYINRYGACPYKNDNILSWKMLYLIRLECKSTNENGKLIELVNATIKLRQNTSNNVVKLWEELTHRTQSVEVSLLSKIDMILANSFYYEIDETSEGYAVGLIIIGLENERSRSKVFINLRIGSYGSSRFRADTEELSIQYKSNNNEEYHLRFASQNLFGFSFSKWGYELSKHSNYLAQTPSHLSDQYPFGLLTCLFIIMSHPEHQADYIHHLKYIESRCVFGLDCTSMI